MSDSGAHRCEDLEPGSDTEFVSLEGTSDSGEVSGLCEQEVKGHASDPAFAAPTWTSVCRVSALEACLCCASHLYSSVFGS